MYFVSYGLLVLVQRLDIMRFLWEMVSWEVCHAREYSAYSLQKLVELFEMNCILVNLIISSCFYLLFLIGIPISKIK